jgi:hypothetical protein
VREICGALRKLTGQQLGEQIIFTTFLSDLPPEQRAQRQNYDKIARAWAEWWERSWEDFAVGPQYSKVDLPPLELKSSLRAGKLRKRLGIKNVLLESVLNPEATDVFYDVDTDSYSRLPDKWRDSGDIAAHMAEILTWAQTSGFDLMGTEYVPADGEKSVHAIRGIGLRTSEIEERRWYGDWSEFLWESLQKDSHPVVGPLLHRDPAKPSQVADPQSTATFMAVTTDGLPVILRVGVDVQTTERTAGNFNIRDPEMDPVGKMKGRRFVVMYVGEVEAK